MLCPRQVLALRVFYAVQQALSQHVFEVRVCMETYVGICRSEVSVYRRAFFSGCSTVFDRFATMWGLRHVDRMN